mmetsp:Transcript_16844/g.51793  ORF Transcript_16844/g.51793 Transcript_16844/m.51793 type:complete len:354 (-) Transcript_16844:10-1071(-)
MEDDATLNLREWLAQLRVRDADAERYATELENQGFDDVQSVCDDIRQEDLEKFMKLGHVRRVLRAVESFRESGGLIALEGSTRYPTPQPQALPPAAYPGGGNLSPSIASSNESYLDQGIIAARGSGAHMRGYHRSTSGSLTGYEGASVDFASEHADSLTTSSVPSSNPSSVGSPVALTAYPPGDPLRWGPAEVRAWLSQFEALAQPHYLDAFKHINGRDVLEIHSNADAESLGVRFRPHKVRLLEECQRLRLTVRMNAQRRHDRDNKALAQEQLMSLEIDDGPRAFRDDGGDAKGGGEMAVLALRPQPRRPGAAQQAPESGEPEVNEDEGDEEGKDDDGMPRGNSRARGNPKP